MGDLAITCYGNVKNGIYNSFKRYLFLDYETFIHYHRNTCLP